jgi:cytochrome c553
MNAGDARTRRAWRRHWMWRGALAGLAGLGLLVVLGVLSGVYNVAASHAHLPPVRDALNLARRQAVALRALAIRPPPLDDEGLVRLGAAHFAIGCAPCHGAPGTPRAPIPLRMLPEPPSLAIAAPRWSAAELFWIVSNGLKFTGMPAWPGSGRADETWALVAFLRRLPGLDAEHYRALAGLELGAPPRGGIADLGGHGGPAETCGRCHDDASHPPVDRAVPRLAGLSARYLADQLRDYAEGRRDSGFMAPVAAALAADEIGRLAERYASQAPPAATGGAAIEPRDIERGRRIAINGWPERALPACVSCHGGDARDDFPSLAGQSAAYLGAQLREYAAGRRSRSAGGALMTAIARRLDDSQFDDLARYFESLAPRARDAGGGTSGRDIFRRSGCGGCHAVRGTDATATIGPDLTHVGARRTLGSGMLANDRAGLARWIRDNQALKPGNLMPPYAIFSDDELGALTGYLAGLR